MSTEIKNKEIALKELILKSKEWFSYVKMNIKTLIIVSIIGALLALSYSFYSKPVYVAKLSFGVEDDRGNGGTNLASQFGLDIGSKAGGLFNGENLIILFKSRTMIEKSLMTSILYKGKKMTLIEYQILINNLRKSWSKNPKIANVKFPINLKRQSFSRIQDSIIGSFSEAISISKLKVLQLEKKSSVVNIEFKSNDELFSKVFTENLVMVVSNYYIQTKSFKAKTNLNILQRQTDSIRGVLNGNIIGVAVANDNTFSLNPAMNVKRVPSAKKNVDLQANSTILTELIKQCEMAKVNLRKETPLIQIIDKPILPLSIEKFGKSKAIILGSFTGGFLALIFLILKKIFNTYFK